MRPELVLPALAVVAFVYLLLPVGLAMRARYRGRKVLRCPRLPRYGVIRVARAGLAEALGIRSLRTVRQCSLWPSQNGCAQGCLAAPEEAIRDSHG